MNFEKFYDADRNANTYVFELENIKFELYQERTYKSNGTYEVELNAESLSSGTYIYRIESNDPSTGSPKGQAGQSFVQVKKMILLK